MSIIKLNPAFKDNLWGGTKLRDLYGKKCDFDIIAESWELSGHSAGQSILEDGTTFSEYIEKKGKEILGKNSQKFDKFPILIKFIDAKLPLSLQVHPDDEYAKEKENSFGKTEVWYIMDAEKDAYIYFGVNKDMDKSEFEKRIEEGTVEEVLNKVFVKKGDVFFIEAGTVHAIGGGILVCEIQQNSDTTYRVFDYQRRDKDGNLRELHIEKAVDVSNLNKTKAQADTLSSKTENGVKITEIASCKYFKTTKYESESTVKLNSDENSFISLVFLEGEGVVTSSDNSLSFKAGESIFIPASEGEIKIDGKCQFVASGV